jgi:hypothetical protein
MHGRLLLSLDQANELHVEIVDALLAHINPNPGRVRRDRKILELHRVFLQECSLLIRHRLQNLDIPSVLA